MTLPQLALIQCRCVVLAQLLTYINATPVHLFKLNKVSGAIVGQFDQTI